MTSEQNNQIQQALRDMLGVKKAEFVFVDASWVSPAEIQHLNKEHRHVDKPTDVLSFPLYSYTDVQYHINPGSKDFNPEPLLLGSLILCEPVIADYAKEHGRTTAEQITWSIKHGLKHLLGYDHDETGETWWPIAADGQRLTETTDEQ